MFERLKNKKSHTRAKSSIQPIPEAKLRRMFDAISSDKHQKQILAILTGHNASNWQQVSLESLHNFLQNTAPTSEDFAPLRKQFLKGISASASPAQYKKYVISIDALESNLYNPIPSATPQSSANDTKTPDKRSDLTNSFEEISAAGDATTDKTSSLGWRGSESLDDESATGRRSASASLVPKISAISPASAQQLLSRAIIDGDAWIQDGQEYHLTTANLLAAELAPLYELTLDSQPIALSAAFELSDARPAMIAYFSTPAGTKVRSFYLDQKSGLWRYAPDIIRGPRGEGFGNATDGYAPESTILAFALQKAAANILQIHGAKRITITSPDFLFSGTAKAYNTLQEFRNALASGQPRGDFYQEVYRDPVYSAESPSRRAPQLISVNSAMSPNFSHSVVEYASVTPLLGPLDIRVFSSHDRQYFWSFCRDNRGRTSINNLETSGDITSTGCRQTWANAGDLATPLYVPSHQASGYGDPTDTRNRQIGMWNTYLSKIPLIQDFVNSISPR